MAVDAEPPDEPGPVIGVVDDTPELGFQFVGGISGPDGAGCGAEVEPAELPERGLEGVAEVDADPVDEDVDPAGLVFVGRSGTTMEEVAPLGGTVLLTAAGGTAPAANPAGEREDPEETAEPPVLAGTPEPPPKAFDVEPLPESGEPARPADDPLLAEAPEPD